jgi:hypothetical protein
MLTLPLIKAADGADHVRNVLHGVGGGNSALSRGPLKRGPVQRGAGPTHRPRGVVRRPREIVKRRGAALLSAFLPGVHFSRWSFPGTFLNRSLHQTV